MSTSLMPLGVLEIEPRTLADNEEIIEHGLASAFEAGRALRRIREKELYRHAGFDGFVEYLRSKSWGIAERTAYKMIDAATVNEIVCPIGQTPIIEAQARELAPLARSATPEVVKDVYAEVVEETGGRPTAKAIREKVQKIIPKRKKPPKKRALTIDLRPEGLLETITAIEELVRALVLIRGNANAPTEQVSAAVEKLEWISEETVETLRVLKEGR